MLKIGDMDNGTKLRTVLAIAASLNTALMATDLTGFHNPTVDFWYKIISLVLNFVIVAINTYMNNDYTASAQVGTDITRALKDDPTLVVDYYDGDDEEEDEPELAEVDEKGDDVIEEGEE